MDTIIPLSREEAALHSCLFEAFAHPVRLRLLTLLLRREGECIDTELAQHFEEEERSSLADHLVFLCTIGIVQLHEKWGCRYPYVNRSVLYKVIDALPTLLS